MKNVTLEGKLVFFRATDGIILQGFLIEARKKDQIAIFIHGMGGEFLWDELLKSSQILIRNNISFFAINTRGAGIVRRYYSNNGSFKIGMAFEKFEESIFDIEGAIRYVKSKGYKKIILIGHSSGCQKSLYFMKKSLLAKHVKAIVLASPADDYNYAKKKLGKNFWKTLRYCKNLVKNGKGNKIVYEKTGYFMSAERFISHVDPKSIESQILNYELDRLEYLRKIEIPTLVILAEKDRFMLHEPEYYKKIFKREIQKSPLLLIRIIKSAPHSYTGKLNKFFSLIAEFSKKALK